MSRSALIAATEPGFMVWPLAGYVRKLATDRSAWLPRVQHHRERWWTPLVASPEVDVWLITWPQDEATELHDHGVSWAAFTVVQGRLTEQSPSPGGGLHSRTLRRGPVAVVPPGDIHDVVNLDAAPAISIHAYSPPLRAMNYYRRTPQGLALTRQASPDSSNSWPEP